jgi:hypothetical protein
MHDAMDDLQESHSCPCGAPRIMKLPSDGGEGAGDGGRQAPGVGSNPKSVTFHPGGPAVMKLYQSFIPSEGWDFQRSTP